MRTDVLGVAFDDVAMDEAVDRALAMLEEDGPHLVVTPNPEIVQRAKQDPEFAQILARAHLVIPDGIGVIYAAKILAGTAWDMVKEPEKLAAVKAEFAATKEKMAQA